MAANHFLDWSDLSEFAKNNYIEEEDTFTFIVPHIETKQPLQFTLRMHAYRPKLMTEGVTVENAMKSLFGAAGIDEPAKFCERFYLVEPCDFQQPYERFPERCRNHDAAKNEMTQCLLELYRLIDSRSHDGVTPSIQSLGTSVTSALLIQFKSSPDLTIRVQN